MKKEFTPAELELIQFDEGIDVITASTQTIGPIGGGSGEGDPFSDEGF